MSDNGQRVPLPGCMIGPSEPCDAFQRQTARIAELEAELETERWRREECDALRAVVREFVWIADEGDKLAYERLYGNPLTEEHKQRTLDFRQRRLELAREARLVDDEFKEYYGHYITTK